MDGDHLDDQPKAIYDSSQNSNYEMGRQPNENKVS